MTPRSSLMRALLLALALCACRSTAPTRSPRSAPRTSVAQPAASLFHRSGAWVGGDSAYSIDLHEHRVLWLFGDSFIDAAADGVRDNGPVSFIRNSVAVQSGATDAVAYDAASASMAFYWGPEHDGADGSYFHDVDGAQQWVWPLHGVRLRSGELLLFRMQVRAASGGLGFETVGWDAMAVDEPGTDPSTWIPRVVQSLTTTPALLMGSALVMTDEHLYAYAVRNDPKEHAIYLARWALSEVSGARAGSLADPHWWCGAHGFRAQSGGALPTTLFADGQVEFSVHYAQPLGRFVETQMLGGFVSDPGTVIALRFATAPEGPWSAPCTVFDPPERSRSDAPTLIAYAAKAHPEQRGADLVITYMVNALGESPKEPLYYPQVVHFSFAQVRHRCAAQLTAGS